jgi:triosephosphate isomerase
MVKKKRVLAQKKNKKKPPIARSVSAKERALMYQKTERRSAQKSAPKTDHQGEQKKERAQPLSRKFLVVANWKMNPPILSEARSLFSAVKDSSRALKNTTIVVCPPFVYLDALKATYSGKKISFGAQTVFTESAGPYTGEVSAEMVKSVGGKYVILGHSERRTMGEDDKGVRARLESAIEAGLTPIVCIGESTRDEEGEYLSLIRNQLNSLFYSLSRDWLKRVVIAYEPIWAIGKTGNDAVTPHALHETAIFIRKVLSEMFDRRTAIGQSILYGGSVKKENAAALIDATQISGFLVGSASLDNEEFMSIVSLVEAYGERTLQTS